MKNLRIAAVAYINTRPFIAALNRCWPIAHYNVYKVPPSECAELYARDVVEIALVPVGALYQMPEYSIITDYCLGSRGAVDTVALLSQKPLQELSSIYLDQDSRTSIQLIEILLRYHWQMDIPTYSGGVDPRDESAGVLLIGDKVKTSEVNYKYKYDLGYFWQEFTGLPMVYAVWIARPSIAQYCHKYLNTIFKQGFSHLDELDLTDLDNPSYWRHYLQNIIQYNFDLHAKKGLDQFLSYQKHLHAIEST